MKKFWKIAALMLVACLLLGVTAFATGDASGEATGEVAATKGLDSVWLSAAIVLCAFALFIFMVFMRVPQFVAIFITVVITCVASQDGFMSAFFDTFTAGCGTGITNTVLLMISGAMFGTVLNAAGCSASIGRFLVQKLGKKNAPYVIIITTILCCLSGSPVYVFVVGAVSVAVLSAADLPMYIGLAGFCGSGLMISFMMPGFSGMPNVIPTMYLGMNIYAGAGIGILCLILGEAFTVWYVRYLTKKAIANGEHYKPVSIFSADEIADDKDLPNFWLSLLPVVVVVALSAIFTSMNMSPVSAVVIAQFAALILTYIMNWKRIEYKFKPLGDSVTQTGEVLLCIVALTGYGTVITTTACYKALLAWIGTLNMNPYVLTVLAVAIIVAITSDGTGGMLIFFNTLAPTIMSYPGVNASAVHRLTTITTTTLDSLPQSGTTYMNMRVFGYTHKDGYKYMFVTTVLMTSVLTVIALVVTLLTN